MFSLLADGDLAQEGVPDLLTALAENPTLSAEEAAEAEDLGSAGAEEVREAVLTNGRVSIYIHVNISERMDDFRIQFSAPDDLDVELRDIPMAEHIYEREERLLSGSEISSQEFTLVLDIYAISTQSGENYPLRILDDLNNRTIETIDIIA